MSAVLSAIDAHAQRDPQKIALRTDTLAIKYALLGSTVRALAAEFRALKIQTIALLADNSPHWALMDLAAMAAGIRCVPLPPYFSAQQIAHALTSSAAELLIADSSLQVSSMPGLKAGQPLKHCFEGCTLQAFDLRQPRGATTHVPQGTQKITFTSGTTGQPKGVCLSLAMMEQVAQSLALASNASSADTHLCCLPLSTLLENLGGLYAPLLAGATACLPSLSAVGLRGASHIDGASLLSALRSDAATSCIFVPQMLRALIDVQSDASDALSALRFLAVGGAPVSAGLLQDAEDAGLRVFQGYGLSECASVVSLNCAAASRRGSVGKPLPHVQISIAEDGEILIRGSSFLGYIGDSCSGAPQALASGDIGYFDADGYLYLTGRKKNMFVTTFGRNVAPEWIEQALCDARCIQQAAVFGESRPKNIAVIVSAQTNRIIEAAIAEVNRGLPDYARIWRWLRAEQAFNFQNQQLTANGRLRREEIQRCYQSPIDALYLEEISV